MSGTNEQPAVPQIPEERRFVWRNLDAFLAGELSEADRARIESFLCECPYTKEYVETERQFVDAVKRCVGDAPECPEGLRSRVLAALDHCENELEAEDEEPKKTLRLSFPWAGAVMFAAASIMLVIALFVVFGSHNDDPVTGLPEGLAPMVAHVSLDAPKADKCHYGDALEAYRRYFADGPELPHELDGEMMKVSKWECEEVDGRRLMCAVYDTRAGERFGIMVFKCNCLEKAAPEGVEAAEVKVGGNTVLLWREGHYFRALVGQDAESLRRHMNELRANV